MKFAHQIMAGFAAMVALCGLLTILAVVQMSMVETNLKTINHINAVKQRQAINFRWSVNNRAVQLRDAVLLENDVMVEQAFAEIDRLDAFYRAAERKLADMLRDPATHDPREQKLARAVAQAESAALPAIERVRAALRAGDVPGARASLIVEARPAIVTWMHEINALIDLEETKNQALTEAAFASADAFRWQMVVLMLLGMVVALWILSWSLKAPRKLRRIAATLEALAQGDRAIAIPATTSRNEIGQITRATLRLRDQLAEGEAALAAQTGLIVDSIGGGLTALMERDLAHRIDADLVGPFATLKADFNAAVGALSGAIGAVADTAQGFTRGAGEIRYAADDLARRTEQQAASLAESTAALSRVAQAVRDNASKARAANEAAAAAADEAEASGAVVARAGEAMAGIEQTSTEIGQIVGLIDGIAFQTNLLALNAGVEAARAGEAGKGFAVVAMEVRALAQRATDAARDIKARIGSSQERVAGGVALVAEAHGALDRIGHHVAALRGMITEIAGASEVQAGQLGEVNRAVAVMDGMTQQNAAMAEQATASARTLAEQAEGLAQAMNAFTLAHARDPAPRALRLAAPPRALAAG